MYYFVYPDNYLEAKPRLEFCAALMAFVGGQMGLLYLQSSRTNTWLFCSTRDEAFNYHILPHDLPSSLVIAKQKNCVKCDTPVGLPGDDLTNVVNTSPALRSPCGHLFHTDCFRMYIETNLRCPVCQALLPVPEDIDR